MGRIKSNLLPFKNKEAHKAKPKTQIALKTNLKQRKTACSASSDDFRRANLNYQFVLVLFSLKF